MLITLFPATKGDLIRHIPEVPKALVLLLNTSILYFKPSRFNAVFSGLGNSPPRNFNNFCYQIASKLLYTSRFSKFFACRGLDTSILTGVLQGWQNRAARGTWPPKNLDEGKTSFGPSKFLTTFITIILPSYLNQNSPPATWLNRLFSTISSLRVFLCVSHLLS